jgi:hypothetical protein
MSVPSLRNLGANGMSQKSAIHTANAPHSRSASSFSHPRLRETARVLNADVPRAPTGGARARGAGSHARLFVRTRCAAALPCPVHGMSWGEAAGGWPRLAHLGRPYARRLQRQTRGSGRAGEEPAVPGQPVPEEKIISRYHRSLDLLLDALRFSDRPYLFDNSAADAAPTLIAEVTSGSELEIKADPLPEWLKTAVWDRIAPSARGRS